MTHADHPHAEGSVRLAATSDAESIARIQHDAWRRGYASLLPPEALEAFDVTAASGNWAAAIAAPPTRRHRVLVALGERRAIVGFAASAPASDDDLDGEHDSEVLALHVAPDHLREGHGSRLMAALADYARDDGFARLVSWVFAADDPMRLFLRENGWDADGSTRDLDVGELVHQVRMHTSFGDSDSIA